MTRTIQATLSSSVVYVTGTVNGEITAWVRSEGNTWQSTVERADDDIYNIVLSVVDNTGRTTQTSLTLYYGLLNLITDRTQDDVEALRRLLRTPYTQWTDEQRAEFISGANKGAYNATDLNRVGGAMNYVAARLAALGIAVSISPKTDWTDNEIPTDGSMAQYLSDLSVLRAALIVSEDTPQVPDSMGLLTYQEANDIEQILLDIDMMITNIRLAWFYAGDIYSGEV